MKDVTLVSGPLGSGKTTFIQRQVLPRFEREGKLDGLTLIVNEAAPTKAGSHLDGKRLGQNLRPDQVKMYGQKCVCCDGLEPFKKALEEVAESDASSLLIEPTGIANANSIIHAIQEFGDAFSIQHALYMFPVAHFSKAQRHDGLVSANTAVLTWMDDKRLEEAQRYIFDKNPGVAIQDSAKFDWNKAELFRLPEINLPMGHDRYKRIFTEINPYLSIGTIQSAVHAIAREVERTKGYVRLDVGRVLQFDGVNGDVHFYEGPATGYDNGEIVIIDQEISDSVREGVRTLEDGVNNAVILKGSSPQEFRKEFDQYAQQREDLPDVVTQGTFEGWDMYVGIAEQSELEGDRSLILEAVPEYVSFASEALRRVPETEHLIGANIGLKLFYYAEKYAPELLPGLQQEAQLHVQHVESLSEADFAQIDAGTNPTDYRIYLEKTANLADSIR